MAHEEPERTEQAAEQAAARQQTSPSRLVVGLIKTLRPQQWVKNVFVLAPLFFSRSYTNPELLGRALLAALFFSLMAGTVYIINDLLDVEKDRGHPTKRNRPIASGVLPVGVALMSAAIIGSGALAAGVALDVRLGVALGVYFVLNLAYSVKLKHVAYLDVLIISIGFVLRVIAGGVAISVFLSEWLLLCTFLITLYLGLGKRLHELRLLQQGKSTKSRPVLEHYHPEHVTFAALFVAGMTIASYTIYTLTAALPEQPLRSQQTPFHSPLLLATIPFAVFGITRFYVLLNREHLESPTDVILRDVVFIANLVAWGALMMVVAFSGTI